MTVNFLCNGKKDFGFPVYSQNFQPETNHYSWWMGLSGVNRWSKGFFPKCKNIDSNWGVHLVKLETSTLKSSVQPLGQPTWVIMDKILNIRICK